GEVHDDDVGFQLPHPLDRLLARGRLAHYLQVGLHLEQRLEARPQHGVVVREQDPDLLTHFATSRPLERAAVLASWPRSVSPAPPRLSLLRSGPGSMPRGRSSCRRVGRDGGLARRGGPWSPALARVPPPRGEIARCVPTPLEVPARLDTADPLPRDRQGGIAWPRRTAAPDPDAMTDPGSGDAKKRDGHP